MFNCQTKRAIVALFIYPEIPPCQFFLDPVIEYLFAYTITQSHTIAIFLPHNLPPKTRTIFIFSHTLSEGLINTSKIPKINQSTACTLLLLSRGFLQISHHICTNYPSYIQLQTLQNPNEQCGLACNNENKYD